MNTSQLESFIAAAQLGSFSKAARQCHISVPSFSQQIQTLENEIGFRLFIRSQKGVTLTAAGESFLETAQFTTRSYSEGLQRAQHIAHREDAALRIGCDLSGQPPQYIINIIALFNEEYPDADAQFIPLSYGDMIKGVLNEDIDLFFFSRPRLDSATKLRFESLFYDKIYCCVQPNGDLASRIYLDFESLAGMTLYVEEEAMMTVTSTKRYYDQLRNVCTIVIESFSTSQMLKVMTHGGGIMLPESYLPSCCPPLHAVRTNQPELEHGITCLKETSPIVEAFIQTARVYFGK